MIRPLKATDYLAAKRLFQQTFDLSEDAEFAAAWNPTESFGYWLCQDTLIGAAICSRNKLHYIYVHDDYREHGIGTQLLRTLPTNLHLIPVNDPVVKCWYQRHGFRLSKQDGDYVVYVRHSYLLRSLSDSKSKQPLPKHVLAARD